MTEEELLRTFGDAEQRGILAEENETVFGWAGWNRSGDTGFYAHSLYVDGDRPHAYLCLIRELRRLARLCGCGAIEFYVDHDQADYLRRVALVKGIVPVRTVFRWHF